MDLFLNYFVNTVAISSGIILGLLVPVFVIFVFLVITGWLINIFKK